MDFSFMIWAWFALVSDIPTYNCSVSIEQEYSPIFNVFSNYFSLFATDFIHTNIYFRSTKLNRKKK